MTSVLEAARKAWRDIPFYRELYGQEPEDEDAVTFISATHYHAAEGLVDCVRDPLEVFAVLPPLQRNFRRFPFTVVEDETEQRLRQERLVAAVRSLGIGAATRRRWLLVADEHTGPFACEWAKGLAWERQQASIVYLAAADGPQAVQRDVAAFEPDLILPVTPAAAAACAGLAVPVVPVVHTDHLAAWNVPVDRPALLCCDELHLVAWRPPGGDAFAYLDSQFVVELSPGSGQWHLTTLAATNFPLIRYGLGPLPPLVPVTADAPEGDDHAG